MIASKSMMLRVAAVAALATGASAAQAAAVATSSGYGLGVSLTATPLLGAATVIATGEVGARGGASTPAMPTYTTPTTPVIGATVGTSLGVSTSVLGLVTTRIEQVVGVDAGVITVGASGEAGVRAAASTEVAGAGVGLDTRTTITTAPIIIPGIPPFEPPIVISPGGTTSNTVSLLSLDLSAITATAAVDDTLSATGTSIIADGSLNTALSIGGLTLDLGLLAAADPNTVLFESSLLGLRIVLNEQLLTGDGINTRGITTNAIHVSFSNFLWGAANLTGDIVIASASAMLEIAPEVVETPEPAALALLGFGVLGIAAMRRRKAVLA